MNVISAILGAGGMAALILDGQTALAGAAAGLELCLRTVIPALFPFLFFSGLLTASLWGIGFSFLHPLTDRLGIPRGAESLLVAALLGGYPAGAQQIGAGFREGRLSRTDACHLLAFCSNAGPAFLFGITAAGFSSLSRVWALWAVQIFSCLLTGRLLAAQTPSEALLAGTAANPARILTQAVKTAGIIGGWIILFQILLAFLDRWCFRTLPETVQVLLTGMLELSSGCCALGRITDENVRFLVCSAMVSLGGLCVTMQTAGVLSGLPLLPYLRGKAIQAVLALGLSALFLRLHWLTVPLALAFFLTLRKKGWISGENHRIMEPSPQGGNRHAVS